MSKKMQELQLAQQAAEGQSQRLAAENDALNKEVGRLRHLEQTRATPTWMTTVPSSPVPPSDGDNCSTVPISTSSTLLLQLWITGAFFEELSPTAKAKAKCAK